MGEKGGRGGGRGREWYNALRIRKINFSNHVSLYYVKVRVILLTNLNSAIFSLLDTKLTAISIHVLPNGTDSLIDVIFNFNWSVKVIAKIALIDNFFGTYL